MPYKYHPPTRTDCNICNTFNGDLNPIVSSANGKASTADNHPIHNWYNFVLGYSPEFPNYMLKREKIGKYQLVVDPFMGSGTTQVCCKSLGISSSGVDANDFFYFVSKVKLNWDIDIEKTNKISNEIFGRIAEEIDSYKWEDIGSQIMLPLKSKGIKDYKNYASKYRPEMLVEKYISDIPFVKLNIIKSVLDNFRWIDEGIKNLFILAFAAIILPSSNVRYGPGFGVIKPKVNVNVLELYTQKVKRMIRDLSEVDKSTIRTKGEAILGDARSLSTYYDSSSVDMMITSPPYPGDHEYTKHSRLELIFLNYAQNLDQFRNIKKRMLRGSTTNIYKDDNLGSYVKDIESISKVTSEIEQRLKKDGGTSGFEKLYSKLVWEYFGGMYIVFKEAKKVLKPGGKFALLVSDSHAFKMVHIETAKILGEVALKAGFTNPHIELWQYKNSTSHKYKLLENILTVENKGKRKNVTKHPKS